ncbi:nuclear transport factor 2 family protein [Streptomyces djakartensis]|uniref:nuclear transport factor 2 family protein n=1 Tax=Streptomyces djakartensis TaxID=68193 RepID=UPI0034DEB74A
MTEDGPGIQAAVEGELALLDPHTGRSPGAVEALLHPDFQEFGASGRHWDRAGIIALLTGTTDAGDRPVVTTGMRGVRLAPDLVHLVYDTELDGRRAHRSSLWRRTDGVWRLYFHQATPFGASAG